HALRAYYYHRRLHGSGTRDANTRPPQMTRREGQSPTAPGGSHLSPGAGARFRTKVYASSELPWPQRVWGVSPRRETTRGLPRHWQEPSGPKGWAIEPTAQYARRRTIE